MNTYSLILYFFFFSNIILILDLNILLYIFMMRRRNLIFGSVLNKNSTPNWCYPSSTSTPFCSSSSSSTMTSFFGLIDGNYESDTIEARVNDVPAEEWRRLDINLDHQIPI